MHRRIAGKLVIATHNPGKLAEMRELLAPHGVEAVSAGELGLAEPEETGDSFVANARIKAVAAAQSAQLPAFADDSGLAVDALDGAPGIFSARWAGPSKDFTVAMTRIERLLQERGAKEPAQRRAHFISALCVAWPDGHLEEVEARADGTLVWPPRGSAGFGYDPMFLPDGFDRTFGEMTSLEKHGLPPLGLGLSHRARAFVKLAEICLDRRPPPWPSPASGRGKRERKRLRRLRTLAILSVEMPVLRFQQPCPSRPDRRGSIRQRVRARDRNHRGARAPP
jgi:XTP/dITP diphosphohydrolase